MHQSAKFFRATTLLSVVLMPSLTLADSRHAGQWNGVNSSNGWSAPAWKQESRAQDWQKSTHFNQVTFFQPHPIGWSGYGLAAPRHANYRVQSGWTGSHAYPGYYGHHNHPYRSNWNSGRYNSRYHSGWGNTYSYGYNDYYYRGRRTKTDTVVLGVGLGVLGLAIASAASKSKKHDWTDDHNRRDVRDWKDPDEHRTYGSVPEPDYDPSLPPAINSSCLQTREYQTTIIVGGKRVPAYGFACLQPDGSWRQGPPVQEPR
jgi:hypothetical protein